MGASVISLKASSALHLKAAVVFLGSSPFSVCPAMARSEAG